MYIKELIDTIKKRPGMFVREEKIEYIYYYISGYCSACHKYSNNDMNKMFFCWFGKWLQKWIENNIDFKYKPKSACWYDDIKTIAECEQKETECFFYLCNIFFDDYEHKRGYFVWRNISNN